MYRPTPAVSSRRDIQLTRVDTRGRVRATEGKYIVRPRPVPPPHPPLSLLAVRRDGIPAILANFGTPNIVMGKGPRLVSRERKRKVERGAAGKEEKQSEAEAEAEAEADADDRAVCESFAVTVESIAWIHLDKPCYDQSPRD